MKLLNKDKLSELCKQNVLQFLQAFLRKIPTSTFLSISDIECSYSGLASSYSNSIVGGNLYDSDFDGKAMKAISFFASKGASTTWWMKQSENIDDTVKKMYSFGFQDLVQLKGMALELKSCKEISIDLPNFSIAIVDSDSSFEDYTSIYANFLAPEYHKDIFEYYKLVASLKAYDTINTMYFVGYLEKKPICIGCLCLSNNTAGIYDVLTLPEMRKQGYAKQMVLKMLEYAKELKYSLCILQSTADGVKLYSSLGFEYFSDFFIMNNEDFMRRFLEHTKQ